MTEFTTPTLTLNDGRELPQLGFGTYRVSDEEVQPAIAAALDTGYELIDTATLYRNESGVGRALHGRADIWLTTKVWKDHLGYAQAMTSLVESLARLGRDSVDLLLIHWPCPGRDKFIDTWRALIDLRADGKVKSIGVSNFRVDDLKRLADSSGVIPAVNQVELHPDFQQRKLRQLHAEMGIATQSWAPLGVGRALEHKAVRKVAEKHGVSPGTAVIAWHLAHGLAPIPKATTPAHMRENFAALQLKLGAEDIAAIDTLDDRKGRIGPDPGEFD